MVEIIIYNLMWDLYIWDFIIVFGVLCFVFYDCFVCVSFNFIVVFLFVNYVFLLNMKYVLILLIEYVMIF